MLQSSPWCWPSAGQSMLSLGGASSMDSENHDKLQSRQTRALRYTCCTRNSHSQWHSAFLVHRLGLFTDGNVLFIIERILLVFVVCSFPVDLKPKVCLLCYCAPYIMNCGGMARLDRIACCRKSILSLTHGVLDRTRNLTNQLCG